MKDKIKESFLFACQMKNIGRDLADLARDYDWYSAKPLAKRLIEASEDMMKKLNSK